MTRKEYDALIGAWEEIKRYCDDAKAGDFCPFAAGGVCKEFAGNCTITSAAFPNGWSRPNPPKPEWTEQEKAAADVLKSSGVIYIKRDDAREARVGLFGPGMEPLGEVPISMFPNIEYNEVVLLSDVVEEG